jgi:hypothetical protein
MLYLKKIAPFFILAFFVACHHAEKRSLQVSQPPDGIKTDSIRTFGDSMQIIKYKNSFDTLLKFNSFLNDTNFYVRPQKIKGDKKLDFSNHKHRKLFITRTTDEVRERGFNFAGHYSFVYWGCGSPCKLSAVVDLITGKVYNGPPAATGYSFKKNSRILIVNPPDSAGFYVKNRIWQPEQYIFKKDSFYLINPASENKN